MSTTVSETTRRSRNGRKPPPTAAEIAAALHTIANTIATLGHHITDPWISLDISPTFDAPDEESIAAVDAVTQALLGQPGRTQAVGATHHHRADGACGPVRVSVWGKVASPTELELRAEVNRLRDQLAEHGTEQQS